LARTWPLLIRALVALRRDGSGLDAIDDAWALAHCFGEPLRTLPAAAAVVENAWLTGADDGRLAQCRSMLGEAPVEGLEWARGELAVWLHRLGVRVEAAGVAQPYRLLLDGDYEAAARMFDELATPYDAALALIDSGDGELARGAVDTLDRLGADAVAGQRPW
jgi:hypothetical protein